MNKMCLAFLGVFLLALHLSTEVVRAQTTMAQTTTAPTTTMSSTMNYTTAGGMNATEKNGCGRTSSSSAPLLLLLPVLGASLLHSWS